MNALVYSFDPQPNGTMTKTTMLAFACVLAPVIAGCKSDSEPADTKDASIEQATASSVDFSGNYVSPDYEQRGEGYDWVAVSIAQRTADELSASVRSRADRKKPTCTFDGTAYQLQENIFRSVVEGKTILFTFVGNVVSISTENPDDAGILNFYCSGGASIAGEYERIDGPLDETQIDKTVFSKELTLQGVGFDISTIKEGSGEALTINPFGLSIVNRPETHQVEGSVTGAEIEDLNSDGFPEIVIYTQAGDNMRGDVIGYSVNNGKSMSRIAFPDIAYDSAINQGYNGHDEFAVVETTLSRRFPIFENGKQTGKMRQIGYKLEDGEASRIFVVASSMEFD